ncbi:MAG: nucleotidyltransferase domain-containing protein [Deltaproteobacteria bacterium]|nr:nucleotidyltransferase domain-containing protein [Deltaproteobacteria bacterium]
MAVKKILRSIDQVIRKYLKILRENNIPIWHIYLFGSYATGSHSKDSDIDLAVFWDKDNIDGFIEDVQLLKFTKDIDLRIEPHSFARTDFDKTNPYIKEILKTGKRVA